MPRWCLWRGEVSTSFQDMGVGLPPIASQVLMSRSFCATRIFWAMQILGIVVGTGAADHLTHSIIEHANVVIAGGCQGLVKQLQTAIFKGALHPVLIGGVQVG